MKTAANERFGATTLGAMGGAVSSRDFSSATYDNT